MNETTPQPGPNTLKIALMLQSYDSNDTGIFGYLTKRAWTSCLRWGEKRYDVRFDVSSLFEDDIIAGRLENEDFSVLIGPGGFGTWHSQEELRERIRAYISNGRSYLGVCGDAVFGTLGFANLSPKLDEIFLEKTAKVPSLEPFLAVANVYHDLSPTEDLKWSLGALIRRIHLSPVSIFFPETGIPTLSVYAKQTLRANWGLLMAVPGDGESMSYVNIDIVYADDWICPKGMLKGKAAQVSAAYGSGRIILSGLHAELRKRTYDIVLRNILWLANWEEKPSFINPTSSGSGKAAGEKAE